MSEKLRSNSPLDAADCSPSFSPETDALRDSYENYEHRTNTEDLWELCASMERERNELAGYLCRIKLPLPVRFVADLADAFPSKNIRMKDEGGYLCIFPENARAMTPGANENENE
jgi:hypothetical protein